MHAADVHNTSTNMATDRLSKAKAFLIANNRDIDDACLKSSYQFTGWYVPGWLASQKREMLEKKFYHSTLWAFLRAQGYVSVQTGGRRVDDVMMSKSILCCAQSGDVGKDVPDEGLSAEGVRCVAIAVGSVCSL